MKERAGVSLGEADKVPAHYCACIVVLAFPEATTLHMP